MGVDVAVCRVPSCPGWSLPGAGCWDGVLLLGWGLAAGMREWLLGWGLATGMGAGCWDRERLVAGVGGWLLGWRAGAGTGLGIAGCCVQISSFYSNRKPTMVVRSHYSFLTDSCHFPWFTSLHELGGERWLLPPDVRGAKVEGGGTGWSH